jgi:hypothetical protein
MAIKTNELAALGSGIPDIILTNTSHIFGLELKFEDLKL